MYTTYLKLHEAIIKRNHERLPGDRAEVKFFSFAADDQLSLPSIDLLLGQRNVADIRDHLRPAIAEMVNSPMTWESGVIKGVRRGHHFQMGDTGKVVFKHQSDKPPNEIDWVMTAVELDQDVRSLGEHVDDMLDDQTVDAMSSAVMKIAGVAGGPKATAAVSLAELFVGVVTNFMKKNKNDQVGYVDQSFVRALDFADGYRKVEMNPDYSGNMWYTYSIATIES
ncbi:MAG: hypothetical protein AAFX52_13205 [Pseudomonadota bacterium]